jgi:hypothetical protein
MRAYTITTTSGPRPKAWLGALVLVAVCSLLAPSIASAEHSSVNAIMGAGRTPGTAEFESGTSQTAPTQQVSPGYPSPSVESGTSQAGPTQQVSPGYPSPGVESGTSQAGPTQQFGPGYSSPSSITGPLSSEPTLVSGSPGNPDEGFDWLSAAIGSAAALALVALGGTAVLTVRRRTAVSPSTASTS